MTLTWIKYSESFMQIPQTGQIISTPYIYWTPNHQQIATAIDYVECVTLSLQTGVFFLLQCFWNYLSNAVAKKSFMGSWEFRFYIFWALGSMAIFPILQWYFRHDVNLREAVPQMAYSVELLLAALLGIRSHFRFKRIIELSHDKGNVSITGKVTYFKDMNIFMTSVLFFMSISLGILCVDGFTKGKLINSSKLATDVLTGNFDTCIIFLWIIGISIFHPLHSADDPSALSQSTTDVENKTPEKGNQRVNQFFADTGPSFLGPHSPIEYPPAMFPRQNFPNTMGFHNPHEFPTTQGLYNSHEFQDFQNNRDYINNFHPQDFQSNHDHLNNFHPQDFQSNHDHLNNSHTQDFPSNHDFQSDFHDFPHDYSTPHDDLPSEFSKDLPTNHDFSTNYEFQSQSAKEFQKTLDYQLAQEFPMGSVSSLSVAHHDFEYDPSWQKEQKFH